VKRPGSCGKVSRGEREVGNRLRIRPSRLIGKYGERKKVKWVEAREK